MIPSAPSDNGTSTRPYLIRALHNWCCDNGFTPYIAVHVDHSVQVPRDYVKNNEIVLNVGFEATHGMDLGNEYIQFKARFGGVSQDIMVPVDHVIAIYARENGQGMAFPAPTEAHVDEATLAAQQAGSSGMPERPAGANGLRLASADGQISSEQRADDEASDHFQDRAGLSTPDTHEPDPTPEPPATGGGRPALKRIK